MAIEEKAEWKKSGIVGKRCRQMDRVHFISIKVGKGYFDCVAMGDDMKKVSGVREGMEITLWGETWNQVLKDKAGNKIQVNGYDFWVPRFIIRGAKFDATKTEAPKEAPPDDDDIPF